MQVTQPRALVSVWDVTLRVFEPPTFGPEGGGGTTRPIQSRYSRAALDNLMVQPLYVIWNSFQTHYVFLRNQMGKLT